MATDRPIIFSAPMVRALLAGRKTQTRRLAISPLRRVVVGDRLWVRESFRVGYGADWYREDFGRAPKPKEMDPATTAVEYLCDGERELSGKSYPSIHMPRWASRLTLIVEDVRIERLRAISEGDATAEGVERGEHPITNDVDGWKDYSIIHAGPHKGKRHPHAIAPWKNARLSFQSLWETLHQKPGERWEDDPTIVALTFRVIHSNIDRIAA